MTASKDETAPLVIGLDAIQYTPQTIAAELRKLANIQVQDCDFPSALSSAKNIINAAADIIEDHERRKMH